MKRNEKRKTNLELRQGRRTLDENSGDCSFPSPSSSIFSHVARLSSTLEFQRRLVIHPFSPTLTKSIILRSSNRLSDMDELDLPSRLFPTGSEPTGKKRVNRQSNLR
ncbi:unnamed protein product [Eruca vesicaria subsp. sativa]|uniref:Uncharacterized protein n=1 Tax=Eruca vesicaria subsp. sativa TaxID=29727 RepID=A0ABC8K727_ERUVS|nr:unnamed protein product [Eruca vesicaria subsp. sativa]